MLAVEAAGVARYRGCTAGSIAPHACMLGIQKRIASRRSEVLVRNVSMRIRSSII